VDAPEFQDPIPDSETEEEIRVIKIEPKWIGFAILAIAVLVGLIFLLRWFFRNYYIRKHDRDLRKEQKKRFRTVKRKRSYRHRKDGRLFP
jgi:hypothetical protein